MQKKKLDNCIPYYLYKQHILNSRIKCRQMFLKVFVARQQLQSSHTKEKRNNNNKEHSIFNDHSTFNTFSHPMGFQIRLANEISHPPGLAWPKSLFQKALQPF